MKKDIRSLCDLEKEDFEDLFKRAFELKEAAGKARAAAALAGKTLGLVFDKPSTRTRVSFEAAMLQLGGNSIFISTRDSQMARNEPVRDTARVLSRYVDCLAIRTFSQDLLNEFGEYCSIPVVNALTDLYHPCQVLSDLMTVIEFKGGLGGLKIAWIGDGNNMAHSWINAAAVLGLDLVLACPQGYEPDSRILADAVSRCKGRIRLASDPAEAVQGADVVNTDVWASMGQETESGARRKVFSPYQVNEALLKAASEKVIVMHCLPAHRGEEITDGVLEGEHSVVWEQSANKLHMHKAVLQKLIAG